MKITNGIFVPCRTCKEDDRERLPDGWSYTVRKAYRNPTAVYISVHRPDCPKRFKAVEIADEP